MFDLVGYVITALMMILMCCFMIFVVVVYMGALIEQRKPKRPKNIKVYAGHCMCGKCPRCGADVTNCDGKGVGTVSFCPCCGRKIQFPNHKAIDGVKSVTAEEYLEGVKRK